MKHFLKDYLSYVVVVVFSMSFLKFAYADAWGDYQALKAANRAQNQANMQQFKDGNMSAQDLEREWDRIAREEHEAAKKVEKEWKEKGEKRGKDAREKYEKDKKKQEEDAERRRQEAEKKMKEWEKDMEERARRTREKAERRQREEEERVRRVREEYERRKDDPEYWKELQEKWRRDYEERVKGRGVSAGPSGRDMFVSTHEVPGLAETHGEYYHEGSGEEKVA